MTPSLRPDSGAPAPEWECLTLNAHLDLLITGVGKANAAGAVSQVLSRGAHCTVLSMGIAGALPGSNLELGALVRITAAVLADEGVHTPHGFDDIARMGFPPIPGRPMLFPASEPLLFPLSAIAPASAIIATVSTCSGIDARAADIAVRTGAQLEDMETGAIALVCERLGIPWGGIRVVSNTTGDRHAQRWDVPGAFAALSQVIGPITAAAASNAL